jgi:membrane-associated phospholipid phosphatase
MNRVIAMTLAATLAVAAAIALLYLFVDREVSLAAYELRHTMWHGLAQRISLTASGGAAYTVLTVGLVLGACDALTGGMSRRARSILYVCLTVAAAMIIGDMFKTLFGRARPPLFFEDGIYGFFPMAEGDMHRSFPSGHSLRIFSAMTALGFVLPKLRVPALAFAVVVGASRVVALRHYPSDVLFGAFIGITVAIWGWQLVAPPKHADPGQR